MRNLLIMMLLVLGTMASAQEKPYRDFAVKLTAGTNFLDDQSAQSKSSPINYGNISLRWNTNATWGWAVDFNFNQVKLDGAGNKQFYHIAVLPHVDLMDIMNLYGDKWTLLGFAGGGAGSLNSEIVGLLSGGFILERKLSESVVLSLDYKHTGIINQTDTWDEARRTSAQGITSVVHNFGIGVTLTPRMFKDKRPHADWYKPGCCAKGDTIINNTHVTKQEITKVIKEEYNPLIREYVFFDHDKEKIRKSELNAIMQIFQHLKDDPNAMLVIRGWASNTKSSAAYNLALSARRCKALTDKFLDLGIPMSRILADPSGKDYDMNKENVHDLARRVELLIK